MKLKGLSLFAAAVCLTACATQTKTVTEQNVTAVDIEKICATEGRVPANNGGVLTPVGPGGVSVDPACEADKEQLRRQIRAFDRRLRYAEATVYALQAEATVNYEVYAQRTTNEPAESQRICEDLLSTSSMQRNVVDAAVRDCENQGRYSAPGDYGYDNGYYNPTPDYGSPGYGGPGYGSPGYGRDRVGRGEFRGGPGRNFAAEVTPLCRVVNSPTVSYSNSVPSNVTGSGRSEAKWKDYSQRRRTVESICAPAWASAEREVQEKCRASFRSDCALLPRLEPRMEKETRVFGDDKVHCHVTATGQIPAGNWFSCRATATAVGRSR